MPTLIKSEENRLFLEMIPVSNASLLIASTHRPFFVRILTIQPSTTKELRYI